MTTDANKLIIFISRIYLEKKSPFSSKKRPVNPKNHHSHLSKAREKREEETTNHLSKIIVQIEFRINIDSIQPEKGTLLIMKIE